MATADTQKVINQKLNQSGKSNFLVDRLLSKKTSELKKRADLKENINERKSAFSKVEKRCKNSYSSCNDPKCSCASNLYSPEYHPRSPEYPYSPNYSPSYSRSLSVASSSSSTGSVGIGYRALTTIPPLKERSGEKYERLEVCTKPCCSSRNRYERSKYISSCENYGSMQEYTTGPENKFCIKVCKKRYVSPLESYERVYTRVHENNPSEKCFCAQCRINRDFLRIGDVTINKSASLSKRSSLSERPYIQQETQKTKSLVKELQEITEHALEKPNKKLIEEHTDVKGLTKGSRSRTVANLLERRRVAELNTAFEQLRQKVPMYGKEDRGLSKIKTLRYALMYISHLSNILSCMDEIASLDDICKDSSLARITESHLIKRKIV